MRRNLWSIIIKFLIWFDLCRIYLFVILGYNFRDLIYRLPRDLVRIAFYGTCLRHGVRPSLAIKKIFMNQFNIICCVNYIIYIPMLFMCVCVIIRVISFKYKLSDIFNYSKLHLKWLRHLWKISILHPQ